MNERTGWREMEKAVASGKSEPLPESLKPLFWDVDFENLPVDECSHLIISRLMELGDEAALHFLMHAFSREDLVGTFKTNRSLSRRSGKFWALILDLKEESCTVKRYPTPFGDCCWD